MEKIIPSGKGPLYEIVFDSIELDFKKCQFGNYLKNELHITYLKFNDINK